MTFLRWLAPQLSGMLAGWRLVMYPNVYVCGCGHMVAESHMGTLLGAGKRVRVFNVVCEHLGE